MGPTKASLVILLTTKSLLRSLPGQDRDIAGPAHPALAAVARLWVVGRLDPRGGRRQLALRLQPHLAGGGPAGRAAVAPEVPLPDPAEHPDHR